MKIDIFGVRILQFDGHDMLAIGLFDGHYTISTSSELIRLHDSHVADGLQMHDVDKVYDEKNVTLYRQEIGWALRAALCTACAAPPPLRAAPRAIENWKM